VCVRAYVRARACVDQQINLKRSFRVDPLCL